MGCADSKPVPTNGSNVTDKKNPVADFSSYTAEELANMTDEQIAAIELGNTSFIKKLKSVDTTRDYTIIVDASGSMMPLWNAAETALKYVINEKILLIYFRSPTSFLKYI